ncbi:mCG146192, partial [Mus musculus]
RGSAWKVVVASECQAPSRAGRSTWQPVDKPSASTLWGCSVTMVPLCVSVCVRQRSASGVFLNSCPVLNLELHNSAQLMARKPQDPPVSSSCWNCRHVCCVQLLPWCSGSKARSSCVHV